MSTVQNKTVQDKTKQDKTVDSSSIFIHRRDSDSNFNLIPENRRRGISKWREAWKTNVIDEGIDPKMVMDSIVQYYESGEGQSEWFRQPSTLLDDLIWQECRESWNAKHPPPVDESVAQEAFERIFDGKDVS